MGAVSLDTCLDEHHSKGKAKVDSMFKQPESCGSAVCQKLLFAECSSHSQSSKTIFQCIDMMRDRTTINSS